VLLFVVGKVVKLTGNYIPIFMMASLAYLIALGLVHLMAPKLEQAKIDEPQAA
jgi:ACS family hexuronate transporter-like MFS transporter